jgi:hypothetical protein
MKSAVPNLIGIIAIFPPTYNFTHQKHNLFVAKAFELLYQELINEYFESIVQKIGCN